MKKVKEKSALRSLWESFIQADSVTEIDNSENLEMATINNEITLSEEDKKILFRALKAVEKNEIRQPLKVKIEKKVRKQRENQNTVPRYQSKVQDKVKYRNDNEKDRIDDENERI